MSAFHFLFRLIPRLASDRIQQRQIRQHEGKRRDRRETYLINGNKIYPAINCDLLKLAVMNVDYFPKIWNRGHVLQRPDDLDKPCETMLGITAGAMVAVVQMMKSFKKFLALLASTLRTAATQKKYTPTGFQREAGVTDELTYFPESLKPRVAKHLLRGYLFRRSATQSNGALLDQAATNLPHVRLPNIIVTSSACKLCLMIVISVRLAGNNHLGTRTIALNFEEDTDRSEILCSHAIPLTLC